MTEMCRKGLHEMTGDNVGVQRSTGKQFCRACKREYRRRVRLRKNPPTTLCKNGLHDMADPDNVYVNPATMRRQCKACRTAASQRRALARAEKQAAAAKEAAQKDITVGQPAAFVVPPGGVRRVGGVRGGPEVAARYRLALAVRASRRR